MAKLAAMWAELESEYLEWWGAGKREFPLVHYDGGRAIAEHETCLHEWVAIRAEAVATELGIAGYDFLAQRLDKAMDEVTRAAKELDAYFRSKQFNVREWFFGDEKLKDQAPTVAQGEVDWENLWVTAWRTAGGDLGLNPSMDARFERAACYVAMRMVDKNLNRRDAERFIRRKLDEARLKQGTKFSIIRRAIASAWGSEAFACDILQRELPETMRTLEEFPGKLDIIRENASRAAVDGGMAEAGADDPEKIGLTPKEQAILDVLPGEDSPMLGKDVVAKLLRMGLRIDEAELSKICNKPHMEARGVRNRRGAGYYKLNTI